ncbi:hypothetical protein LAV72_07780 [Lysinibacillus xylanilyticus]|uniref:hypothetical protein n=1 Tax=Lysinibacillus xylanilyticus TaxID=582475 RepID=UPI002B242DD6|nr:hypothetical protein [Lysinibacillus xylanilyticus]MEB2299521.1 hypothetical protein [Lysinibacillus xylanilyticus]
MNTRESKVEYPRKQGEYPRKQGKYPRKQGKYPRKQGKYPRKQGKYPRKQGKYPQEQGNSHTRQISIYRKEYAQIMSILFWFLGILSLLYVGKLSMIVVKTYTMFIH